MFYYIWQSGCGHACVRKCLTISFLSACLLGASSVHLLSKERTTDRKTNSQNTELPSHLVNTTLRCLPIKKWWTCEQMGKRDVLWTDGRSVPRLHSLRWLTGGPTAARAGEGRQPFSSRDASVRSCDDGEESCLLQNPSEKLKFRGCVYRLEIPAGEPTALGLRQAAPQPAHARRTPTHTVKGRARPPNAIGGAPHFFPPLRGAAALAIGSAGRRRLAVGSGGAANRRRCEPAALWAGRPAVRREVREGPGRRRRCRCFRVRGEAAAEDDGVSA